MFGVSICATALNQVLRKSLQAALKGDKNAEEISDRVRQSLSYLRELDPALREIVVECYGKGVRAAIGVSIVLVLGSSVFAWFIREKKLGK